MQNQSTNNTQKMEGIIFEEDNGVYKCKAGGKVYHTPSEFYKACTPEYQNFSYKCLEIKLNHSTTWLNLQNYKNTKYPKKIRGWNKKLFHINDKLRKSSHSKSKQRRNNSAEELKRLHEEENGEGNG